MRLSDLFWSRRDFQALMTAVQEARSAADDAKAAASAARTATDDLGERLSAVDQQLAALHAAAPLPESSKEIRKLWMRSALAIVIGALISLIAAQGLYDPDPKTGSQSSVEFLLEPGSAADAASNHPLGKNFNIELDATYGKDGAEAYYQMFVPARFAGRRFVFALTNAARLRDLEFGDIPDPKSDGLTDINHGGKCTSGYFSDDAKTTPCQIVSGVVPQPESNVSISRCRPEFPKSGKDLYSFSRIVISGTSISKGGPYWSHRFVELPEYSEEFERGPNALRGYDLAGSFVAPAHLDRGCRIIGLNGNDSLASSNIRPVPTLNIHGTVAWQQSGPFDIYGTAVIRRSYASVVGNVGLALGAFMAAVGLGFMPIAYERGSQRRQLLRARSKSSSSPPP